MTIKWIETKKKGTGNFGLFLTMIYVFLDMMATADLDFGVGRIGLGRSLFSSFLRRTPNQYI